MADNNTPINLRIKFKKTGRLQYISHLDLVRTMQRVIIRSKLPLWFTEGFNPKPKMVFAAPLSIGTESSVEFMDIRLIEKVEPAKAIEALNRNLTDELCVLDAYYPATKFSDLKWMLYFIRINTSGASDALADMCNKAFSRETVMVMKKKKKGVEELVDIKSQIKSVNVVFDGECLNVFALLSADPSAFLNPENIVKYLKAECGVLSSENILSEKYSIVRQQAFFEDMSEFS